MLFATYLDASTSMVTIYTEDMVHIKSAHGLDERQPRCYPLDEALGMYATDHTRPQMIVVPDALQDKRYDVVPLRSPQARGVLETLILRCLHCAGLQWPIC